MTIHTSLVMMSLGFKSSFSKFNTASPAILHSATFNGSSAGVLRVDTKKDTKKVVKKDTKKVIKKDTKKVIKNVIKKDTKKVVKKDTRKDTKKVVKKVIKKDTKKDTKKVIKKNTKKYRTHAEFELESVFV